MLSEAIRLSSRFRSTVTAAFFAVLTSFSPSSVSLNVALDSVKFVHLLFLTDATPACSRTLLAAEVAVLIS